MGKCQRLSGLFPPLPASDTRRSAAPTRRAPDPENERKLLRRPRNFRIVIAQAASIGKSAKLSRSRSPPPGNRRPARRAADARAYRLHQDPGRNPLAALAICTMPSRRRVFRCRKQMRMRLLWPGEPVNGDPIDDLLEAAGLDPAAKGCSAHGPVRRTPQRRRASWSRPRRAIKHGEGICRSAQRSIVAKARRTAGRRASPFKVAMRKPSPRRVPRVQSRNIDLGCAQHFEES